VTTGIDKGLGPCMKSSFSVDGHVLRGLTVILMILVGMPYGDGDVRET